MRFFLFFLAFCCCAFAEENFNEIPDVCTTEGLPDSLIEGVVCAISGEYTESCTDLTVAGIEPLTIGRNYSNLSNPFWSLNHVNLLGTGHPDNGERVIRMRLENGSHIDFTAEAKRSSNFSLRDPKGLTNASGSGRHYLKNMKAHMDRHKEKISVINGSGDQKRYKSWKKGKGYYLIQEHKKANGASFTYQHDKDILFGLSKICCRKEGHIFSHVSIRSTDDKKGMKKVFFQASDGKKLTYLWGSGEILLRQGATPLDT